MTRAGGWPYSRGARWSDAKIDRGKRSVNSPPQNARYWENSLKPVGEERGAILKSVQRPPITDTQRRVGKRAGERETVKSCRHRVRLRKGHNILGEWIRPFHAYSPPEFHNRRVIRV